MYARQLSRPLIVSGVRSFGRSRMLAGNSVVDQAKKVFKDNMPEALGGRPPTTAEKIADQVQGKGESTKNRLKEEAESLKETVKDKWNKATEKISDEARSAKEQIKGQAKDSSYGQSKSTESVKETIKDEGENLAQQMKEKARSAKEQIKDKAKEAADKMKGTSNYDRPATDKTKGMPGESPIRR